MLGTNLPIKEEPNVQRRSPHLLDHQAEDRQPTKLMPPRCRDYFFFDKEQPPCSARLKQLKCIGPFYVTFHS